MRPGGECPLSLIVCRWQLRKCRVVQMDAWMVTVGVADLADAGMAFPADPAGAVTVDRCRDGRC